MTQESKLAESNNKYHDNLETLHEKWNIYNEIYVWCNGLECLHKIGIATTYMHAYFKSDKKANESVIDVHVCMILCVYIAKEYHEPTACTVEDVSGL